MTEPCSYDRYSGLHGAPVEPCRCARIFDTPYCLDHLHRVAWLSIGVRVVTLRVVPWWGVLGLLLLGAVLGAGADVVRVVIGGGHDYEVIVR